jgi:hypothetical protein
VVVVVVLVVLVTLISIASSSDRGVALSADGQIPLSSLFAMRTKE